MTDLTKIAPKHDCAGYCAAGVASSVDAYHAGLMDAQTAAILIAAAVRTCAEAKL